MVRRWQVWSAAAALAAWGLMPAGVQAAATTVSVQVSPVQRLEGDTLAVVPADRAAEGTVVVKSNIAWTLVAEVSGSAGGVLWRADGGPWRRLGTRTPVLSGRPGMYPVRYEVRPATAGAGPAHIRLSLSPQTP